MRKIAFRAFAIAAFLPLAAFADPNVPIESAWGLWGECAYETIDVRACLQKKRAASELDLKRAEASARDVLARWDEEDIYVRKTLARLAASGEAFAKYRTVQCAFVSSLGDGAIGTVLEVQRLACIAELNNRQADRLRDAASDVPLKTKARDTIVRSPSLARAAPDGFIQTEREVYEACSWDSQVGVRHCLAKSARNSQNALRQAEEKAADRLSQWDEDDRYVYRAKARLAASNEAFAEYREAQCEFSASLSGGGLGGGVGRSRCITVLNNRRASQLEEAVSDLPWKFVSLSPSLAENTPHGVIPTEVELYTACHAYFQPEMELYESCGGYSPVIMPDCLKRKAKDSQEELTKAEKKMVDALSKWDEDDHSTSEAQAELVASNEEFAKYREAQCRFAASLRGGGASDAREMGRLACVAELNNRRARQLYDAASSLLVN